MKRLVMMIAVVCLAIPSAAAEHLALPDGLAAVAEGVALSEVSLDGRALEGVSVRVAVLDPRTGEAAQGFDLDAGWSAQDGALTRPGRVAGRRRRGHRRGSGRGRSRSGT